MEKQYLIGILTISATQAYGAILPVVKGEAPNKQEVRKSYALTALYVLAFGAALTYATDSPEPLVASIPIILGTIAAQEWAIALHQNQGNREQ